MTAIFLLFFGIPTFVVIYMFFAAKRLKTKVVENQAEENNEKIGPTFELNKANVRVLYLNNQLDDFLKLNYPGLKSWKCRGENIAIHYEGVHIIDLFFLDGSQKNITLSVQNGKYSVLSKENDEKKCTPEEIVAEWMSKWKDFLLEKHNLNEGFELKREDFPEDESILELILDKISLSGNFSTQYTDSGVLFAIE